MLFEKLLCSISGVLCHAGSREVPDSCWGRVSALGHEGSQTDLFWVWAVWQTVVQHASRACCSNAGSDPAGAGVVCSILHTYVDAITGDRQQLSVMLLGCCVSSSACDLIALGQQEVCLGCVYYTVGLLEGCYFALSVRHTRLAGGVSAHGHEAGYWGCMWGD